ncbi:hypothetical protein BBP40_003409 [Aspergillus hancockii]|nr:hypothetical protein BBP40_003409 [Aspergillus hancockii]
MAGGDGRFCTVLMRAFQEQTKRLGADGAIGISVKIEDGNSEILYSAIVEVLEQPAIGTMDMCRELVELYRPKILNTAGVVTGHTSHLFRVRAVY